MRLAGCLAAGSKVFAQSKKEKGDRSSEATKTQTQQHCCCDCHRCSRWRWAHYHWSWAPRHEPAPFCPNPSGPTTDRSRTLIPRLNFIWRGCGFNFNQKRGLWLKLQHHMMPADKILSRGLDKNFCLHTVLHSLWIRQAMLAKQHRRKDSGIISEKFHWRYCGNNLGQGTLERLIISKVKIYYIR